MKVLFLLCLLTQVPVTDSLDLLVERVHDSMISIDTHNDFSMQLAFPEQRATVTKGQVSFELMKTGRLDAAFFAAYQGQGPCTGEDHGRAKYLADSMLMALHRYAREHRQLGAVAYSAADVRTLKKQGKASLLLSIENAYCLGRDISLVEHYYRLGVRMICLTHNGNNCVADAAMDSLETHGGLSPFGYQVIQEMNRLGMIVDVSHASRKTCLQAVQASKTPVMASHSGVYNLKKIPRNLTDEEIIAIASRGGLIQISIGRYFLSNLPKAEVGMEHLLEHINYVVDLVGIDHVGIGSDFDGGGGIVGVEDMGKMKAITRALLEQGYTEGEIGKLWGGNVLRVMEEVARNADGF
ncbi:MAG TPA: dipeptidase [Bacteroidales bacterium]|jgi:membrane dipeptidase|nr:dipeptidase [Bacteroidales bacterium]HQM98028.1 dipeptidase [Bacteroidales bacterium]